MNYRHAFGPVPFADGSRGDNVGRYLFELFPGRVHNVMLNQPRPLPGTTDHDSVESLVQDGKWDAAFAAVGNPDVGFDFKASPFGADRFDLFDVQKNGADYQEIFTGFVFYKPMRDHRMEFGVPGVVSDDFLDTFLARWEITGFGNPKGALQDIQTFRRLTYEEVARWPAGGPQALMDRWLIRK